MPHFTVTIEHTNFRFAAMKGRDGAPFIVLKPKGKKNLTCLGDDGFLTVQLRAGTSLLRALAVARELNDKVEHIRLTRIREVTGR